MSLRWKSLVYHSMACPNCERVIPYGVTNERGMKGEPLKTSEVLQYQMRCGQCGYRAEYQGRASDHVIVFDAVVPEGEAPHGE